MAERLLQLDGGGVGVGQMHPPARGTSCAAIIRGEMYESKDTRESV